jgi:hypothetical protein
LYTQQKTMMAGICIDKELTSCLQEKMHLQIRAKLHPAGQVTMKSPTGTGAAPCRRSSAFSQNLLVKGRFFPYNTNTYISQERRRGT